MEKQAIIEEKLALLARHIDGKSFKMLQVAVHYYYDDVTLIELQDMYGVSDKFVRVALHGNLVKEFFGEDFYTSLQEKCHYKKRTAYTKRNLLDIRLLSEEELLSISVIKKEDVSINNQKKLKMMRVSIVFLEDNYSYSEMASILGYSKASISNYLTDKHLEDLLKEEYYQMICEKLESKKPAPSKSILTKKERLSNFIDFIGGANLTLEALNDMDIYRMAKEFGISRSSMDYYLHDPYLEELIERRGKNK